MIFSRAYDYADAILRLLYAVILLVLSIAATERARRRCLAATPYADIAACCHVAAQLYVDAALLRACLFHAAAAPPLCLLVVVSLYAIGVLLFSLHAMPALSMPRATLQLPHVAAVGLRATQQLCVLLLRRLFRLPLPDFFDACSMPATPKILPLLSHAFIFAADTITLLRFRHFSMLSGAAMLRYFAIHVFAFASCCSDAASTPRARQKCSNVTTPTELLRARLAAGLCAHVAKRAVRAREKQAARAAQC